ncbi:MAG: hypothetical protein Kow0029_22450 [Candidatus Rifleibacteriota bacterium]
MDFRPFAVLVPLIIIFFMLSAEVFASKTVLTEVNQLQTELDAINIQIDYLKLKQKEKHSVIDSIEKKIRKKKNEILELEKQTSSLNEKQIRLSERISELETQIKKGQSEIQNLLQRFRARLVQLHKIKQGTLLSSIFSAKNLNSFLNRFQMVKYLLENDKDLLEKLKKQNIALQESSKELARKQRQCNQIADELKLKRKKIDLEKASLQAMLKTVVLEKKLFLAKEKKLAEARAALEAEISKAEAARKSHEESFENELARTEPKAAEETAPAKLPESAPEAAKLMKFSWPIKNDEIKSLKAVGDEKNAALIIEVYEKSEIQAIGKGKVLYKGNISGLGNVIILGHQRGFSSVYANVDDIWVGLGQIVEQGETIGRIFGGHKPFHFEIRFAGKKQAPLAYLPANKIMDSN